MKQSYGFPSNFASKQIIFIAHIEEIQSVPPICWQLWTEFWNYWNHIFQKVRPVLKSLIKHLSDGILKLSKIGSILKLNIKKRCQIPKKYIRKVFFWDSCHFVFSSNPWGTENKKKTFPTMEMNYPGLFTADFFFMNKTFFLSK